MHRRSWLSVALVLLIGSCIPVLAQDIPATPETFATGTIPDATQKTIDDWADQYHKHQWPDLQRSLWETLKKGTYDHGFTFDPKAYYSVIFADTTYNPKGEILRVLLHDPAPEPYANRLPGVTELFEVFVASSSDASLKTSYSSTHVDNPLTEKSADFVKQFDLAKLGKVFGYDAAKHVALVVVITKVQLPERRATIKVSDKLELPQSTDVALDERTAIATKAGKIVTKVQAAGSDPCLTTFATGASDALAATTRPSASGPPPDMMPRADLLTMVKDAYNVARTSDACYGAIAPTTTTYVPYGENGASSSFLVSLNAGDITKIAVRGDELLATKTDNTTIRTVGPTDYAWRSIADARHIPVDYFRDDAAALGALKDQFDALITSDPLEVTADTTYDNAPPERLTFGAITGLMVSVHEGHQRVKVSDGKLAADPLSGTITLGTLIFRPAGTDPKARAFPASERWTLFVGGVLTPEFGLSGGAGFNLNRKISLNAGIAFLRIDTLKAGETVGSAPVSDKPLKNGVARTVFVGFGYNF